MAVKKKLADLIGDVLDMSSAARRKRAREQGYDTKKLWYHGTPSGELKEFSRDKVGSLHPASFGHHFSNEASEAKMYAGDGGSIGKYVARPENPLVIEIDKYSPYVSASDKADSSREHILKAIRDAADDGNIHDSVLIRRPMETHTAGEFDRYNENLIMLDNNKIRSINAAFDPDKRDSANLLASAAPLAGATALGALTAGGSNKAQAGQKPMPIRDRTTQATSLEMLAPTAQEIFDQYGSQDYGTIEGAVNPKMASLANFIGKYIKTPIDPLTGAPLEGVEDWARKAAYGRTGWGDRGMAALDLLP